MKKNEEKCSDKKLQKIAHLFEQSLENLLKEDLTNEELQEIIEILFSVPYFNHLIEKIGKRILLNDPTDNDILFVYSHVPSLREDIKNKLNKD